MTKHQAQINHASDESVHCPVCSKLVFDPESEDPAPLSPHLVACMPWQALDFDVAPPAIRKWWQDDPDSVDEELDTPDPEALARCPAIQHIVQFQGSGMACGPVQFTMSLGFHANPDAKAE
jgi:hypothetical protein